ncbi:hypothetical protein DYBT9275_04376 [Dyadobacter sp. CECT 9275]|uniref:Sigma-70 family RNA polymerase sigma factor n=1 Tax=Dyadobacter helix TaxID=2822344 RepID=A0A916JHZ3_9BACT|nr:sigma-70 family RNA polymerase sigma factor [Dyadobacter sp. CECT 9275]CAG5008876.1 hypothetical protein DYBT9275_04376 [Dyadobacter sp. CECT 9275]
MVDRHAKSEILSMWVSFKAGDERALRSLMELYLPKMYNYGSKFSNDREFIKDCIQDVFIGMWQYRENLALPDSPKAYLLTALRRKMFSSRSRITLTSLDPKSDMLFSTEQSAEDTLIERESIAGQNKLVAHLLGRLPERQREVIYLKFYQGLDRHETAAVMGISDQSVSNLFQKALNALKSLHSSGVPVLVRSVIHLLLICRILS